MGKGLNTAGIAAIALTAACSFDNQKPPEAPPAPEPVLLAIHPPQPLNVATTQIRSKMYSIWNYLAALNAYDSKSLTSCMETPKVRKCVVNEVAGDTNFQETRQCIDAIERCMIETTARKEKPKPTHQPLSHRHLIF